MKTTRPEEALPGNRAWSLARAMARRWQQFAAALIGMLMLAAPGWAQTTIYRYTGANFNTFCLFFCQSVPFTLSPLGLNDRLMMTLELPAPVAPNTTVELLEQNLPFALTMTAGPFSASFSPGVAGRLRISTDANGKFENWIVDMPGTFSWSAGGGGPRDHWGLGSPIKFVQQRGTEGTWTIEQSIAPTLSFGSATRTLHRGPLNLSLDETKGGASAPSTATSSAGPLIGTEAARGQVSTAGPVAGAWSMAVNGWGSARGIAFRSYRNATNAPISFKVNAAFDGASLPAMYRIASGPLKAGGAVHVFDSNAFAAKLEAAGGSASSAQTLLGGWQPSSTDGPTVAFTQLRGLFPTGLLGSGESLIALTAPGPASASVVTSQVTVQPYQQFTVVYDVVTSAVAKTVGERSASGTSNFLNTLKPAPVHFTGAAGEPVAGIVQADGAPAALPRSPTSLGLAPAASQHPAGGTASIAASVRVANPSIGATNDAPVADVPVEFYVTAGPNEGRTGVAVSDANGIASFSYLGDNDVGKDVLQARIGAMASNAVEHTWTAARCPQNQAFWVRYPGLWPLSMVSIGGGAPYDQQALIKLLKLPPQNPSLALVQQVAVTKLNAAYGGDTSRLALYVLSADSLLASFNRAQPQQNQVDLKTSIEMVALAARMAIYNLGGVPKTCQS
ncbi:hypothetical protein VARIO8X_130143 [Burkholderiales bacterium 8X]|nr:hypothetical protein VARIO8X_130143 [Burkholderiales bacterium 8X]